jgi:hypothetical protein
MSFFGYKSQKVTQKIGTKSIKVTQTFCESPQTLKSYKTILYKQLLNIILVF